MDHFLGIVRGCSTLCLDVRAPGWENARGYLFDPASDTLYFPVAEKYLAGRNLDRYEVLIWSQPRVLVVGRLASAVSDEEIQVQAELAAARGMEPGKIDYLLFDQRNHKPRKNRHKLVIEKARAAGAELQVAVCRAGPMPGAGLMIPMCDDQENMWARACSGYAPAREGQGLSQ